MREGGRESEEEREGVRGGREGMRGGREGKRDEGEGGNKGEGG